MTEPKVTRQSGIYSPGVIEDIQTKAELGRYRIRGFGTLRTRPMPTLDDLVFIPCTLTRIPLEGYREKCSTRTVLGTRHAEKPIVLDTPVMVTGMSYGALSYNAKVALAQGASRVGSSTTTGDGGMLPAEREHSDVLIYEVLPSRYGIDVHHMKAADGIELTIGQGAKPGTGGMLLGSKVSSEIAGMRDLPDGVDQRSPCRHPDFLGPDDMIIKIEELREATDWQVPIFVKMGATRVYDDVKLAAKAGADVVVVDGMEGGTGASPDMLMDHTGIPTLAAVCEARAALEDLSLFGEVQLIMAGGIRSGTDVAKALALGADAVYMGTAFLIALNCNKPIYVEDYHEPGDRALLLPPLPHRALSRGDHHPGPGPHVAAAHRRGGRPGGQLLPGHELGNPDAGPGLRQVRHPRPGPGGPAGPDPGVLHDRRSAPGGDPPGLRRRRRLEGIPLSSPCRARLVRTFSGPKTLLRNTQKRGRGVFQAPSFGPAVPNGHGRQVTDAGVNNPRSYCRTWQTLQSLEAGCAAWPSTGASPTSPARRIAPGKPGVCRHSFPPCLRRGRRRGQDCPRSQHSRRTRPRLQGRDVVRVRRGDC